MTRETIETFECTICSDDTLSVVATQLTAGGAFLEITYGDDLQNVLLTYEQVKILRKALKKCMNRHGN